MDLCSFFLIIAFVGLIYTRSKRDEAISEAFTSLNSKCEHLEHRLSKLEQQNKSTELL